jgi:hypothetical protein
LINISRVEGRVWRWRILPPGDVEDRRIVAIAVGTLYARYVREKPLNKENDFLLEGDWTIEFLGTRSEIGHT